MIDVELSDTSLYIPVEVDRMRERFEKAWNGESGISIEQFLTEVPENIRSILLRELLFVEFEFLLRKKVDEVARQPLTSDETLQWLLQRYAPRFAEHEDIVREVALRVLPHYFEHFIEQYTLFNVLGCGGMGIVYRAKHNLLKHECAIKIIHREYGNNQEAHSRFIREIEIIGAIKHPNIAQALDAGIVSGSFPFLVMELVDGISLKKWRTTMPSIQEKCTVIRDVALGLQALHEAHIVHRDIKPDNVMVQPNGQVKICDLGLAKLQSSPTSDTVAAEPQTLQGHRLGTPGYIAPEQELSPAAVDSRADIYSLGCTFFYLIHGYPPAGSQSKEGQIRLPRRLESILDRMLAADAGARFQEPREVSAALDSFLHPLKHILKITSLVIGILAAVVLGTLIMLNSNEPPALPQSGNGKPTPEKSATLEQLRASEAILRDHSADDADERLAEVLTAQADCTFFDGIASDRFRGKRMEQQMVERYKKALELTQSESLRTQVLCKLTILERLQKTSSKEKFKARFEQIQESELASDHKNLSLYIRLTNAVLAEEDHLLRDCAERFEFSEDPELMTQEAFDLRLFALERLISTNMDPQQNILTKDWRLLDSILSDPYLEAKECVYLNRFFDWAIRVCSPTDYSLLVKYSLHRLGPQGQAGERLSLPPGSTFVGFYFSFWSDEQGFAIYYPDDRQKSQRFELPYNRTQVKEAISRGESLALDETLVALMRHDLRSGVPMVLVWDDTACWADRSNALNNDDWLFEQWISLDEILGEMK